jgi:hypothetical protein
MKIAMAGIQKSWRGEREGLRWCGGGEGGWLVATDLICVKMIK